MDPNATLERWREARRTGNRREAREALQDLRAWLSRGGFEPQWEGSERVIAMGVGGRLVARNRTA